MFVVNSKLQYVFHYIGEENLANAVRDDLVGREDCEYPEMVEIEDHGDEHADWDPGGILMMGDDTFTFELESMNVEIYRQHLSHFIHYIQDAIPCEQNGIKYYKIYSGYLSCLCVTENELTQLKAQIDASLIVDAEISIKKKQDKIDNSFGKKVEIKVKPMMGSNNKNMLN